MNNWNVFLQYFIKILLTIIFVSFLLNFHWRTYGQVASFVRQPLLTILRELSADRPVLSGSSNSTKDASVDFPDDYLNKVYDRTVSQHFRYRKTADEQPLPLHKIFGIIRGGNSCFCFFCCCTKPRRKKKTKVIVVQHTQKEQCDQEMKIVHKSSTQKIVIMSFIKTKDKKVLKLVPLWYITKLQRMQWLEKI